MKKVFYLVGIIASTMLTGCGGQQQNGKDIDSVETAISPDSVSVLQEYQMTDTITVKGTKYTYTYSFRNDKSLPLVVNSFGYTYYDNAVDVVIRKDTAKVYSHTFTKESFKSHISDKDISNYALLGFNFNYMKSDDHSMFHFIASIGDCDESGSASYPMAIDITLDGKVIITQARDIETGPQLDMNVDPEEEDGV